ncbi:MAG: hypothetical protein ABSC94_28330 [Polyangiaceae bacterium]
MGANFGNGTVLSGTDNTRAFVDYLNSQSSASVAQLGCGQDSGCTSPLKPTLDQAFLSQYDVLIFQWMTNSLTEVTSNGLAIGLQGQSGGYWNFTSDELTALTTWVDGGGGVEVQLGVEIVEFARGDQREDVASGPGMIVGAIEQPSPTS